MEEISKVDAINALNQAARHCRGLVDQPMR